MSDDQKDLEPGAPIDDAAVVETLDAAEAPEPRESVRRDTLSIAIVAGLAALLLICVVLVLVANRHRPAGL